MLRRLAIVCLIAGILFLLLGIGFMTHTPVSGGA